MWTGSINGDEKRIGFFPRRNPAVEKSWRRTSKADPRNGPTGRDRRPPAGTARRRRAEPRTAVLRRWPATAGPPASCCENAAATSPTVRMGLSARIANGAMVRTAWNADLRSASRGSAKPEPMTRRQVNVSAAPFSFPAGCASGPIMRVSSGGDLQTGTAARRTANGAQPSCADRPTKRATRRTLNPPEAPPRTSTRLFHTYRRTREETTPVSVCIQ